MLVCIVASILCERGARWTCMSVDHHVIEASFTRVTTLDFLFSAPSEIDEGSCVSH